MALGKVIQRIEIEMSGGTKQYMVSAKQGDRATRYVETVLLNHGKPYTIPRQDPASQLSSENQIDTGYIHRVNSRTML